jgi:hypothetical protein
LESLKGRYHSQDLGVDGGINIKMNLREVGYGDVDWIHLAEDRDLWRALMSTVMNEDGCLQGDGGSKYL